MSRSLKLYISLLAGVSALALVLASIVCAQDPTRILGLRPQIALLVGGPTTPVTEANVLAGLGFWILITLFAGALPVRMPRGMLVSVAIAPIVAAMALGGPVAAGWVALLGTTEGREVSGKVPWYGTVANHAGVVLPAIAGSVIYEVVRGASTEAFWSFVATVAGAVVLFVLNFAIASVMIALGLDSLCGSSLLVMPEASSPTRSHWRHWRG